MVMNIIQAVSIFLLIVAFPETSFNRSRHPAPPSPLPPIGWFRTWLKNLRLMPYWGKPTREELLKPLKGLISSITLLTFVLTSLPIASVYAFALSLSAFLSATPLFIFPSQIGYIFLGPTFLSLVSHILLSAVSPGKPIVTTPDKNLRKSQTNALRIAVPGLILFTTGAIAFSQYVYTTLLSKDTQVSTTVFVMSDAGADLSLKVVGLVFGVAVTGAVILKFAVERYLGCFRGGEDEREGRETGGLEEAHTVWQNAFTGFMILGMPGWVEGGMGMEMGGVMGLKDTAMDIFRRFVDESDDSESIMTGKLYG